MAQRNINELLELCLREGNAAEWFEIIARLHPLIRGVVAKTARSCGVNDPSTLDDLAQDTFLKLFKDERQCLVSFRARDNSELGFFAFVKVIASNVVIDFRKRQTAQKRGSEDTVILEEVDIPTPEPSQFRLLPIDVERIFSAHNITPRDEAIFWLCYRQGYTAREISLMPFGLTIKGVEACLHRLVTLLRDQFGTISAVGSE